MCGKDAVQKYRPFCSGRCADLDLGKWLTGEYAIPADDAESMEEAAEESARQEQKPN
ncbi:zinc-binding protein [Actibacterium lipolyticum]|uniref:Zinc-binding protein n=2 Tax=Actibacterium lipolyticum TaxID=1524263 RepID=A0A238JQ27_9RHOB|nr:zinc-binding protein [Actibacterium lipolyticum]